MLEVDRKRKRSQETWDRETTRDDQEEHWRRFERRWTPTVVEADGAIWEEP